MEPHDPIRALWVHAFRAELDALVTRFQAQVEGHVVATSDTHRTEVDTLRQRLLALSTELQQANAALTSLRNELARAHADAAERAATIERLGADLARSESERARAETEIERLGADLARSESERARAETEIERLGADLARSESERARAETEIERLETALRELNDRTRSLDEQFAAERDYVEALTRASGTLTFEAAENTLGQALEATPACLGALKARKLEGALAAIIRERGRNVVRHPLTAAEYEALAAAARAAGCELIDVPAGQRFANGTMEKAGTRPEPAEEDNVLECVMPGLRLAGSPGAIVHPRVIVATA
jgi:DNA repair exonuclease SbcCD ATPase subunit